MSLALKLNTLLLMCLCTTLPILIAAGQQDSEVNQADVYQEPPPKVTTALPDYDFVLGALGKAIQTANHSNGMALELFRRVTTQENVFLAPFSVATVLALIYQGAAGKTAEEISEVLGYDYTKDLRQFLLDGFKSTRALINEQTGENELVDVNAMLVATKIKLFPDLKQKLEHGFGATVESANFQRADTLKLLDTIVEVKTRGHIKKAFGNREVPPNTLMVVGNVIFFRGIWEKQFDPKNTVKETFLNNGHKTYAKEVDFMTMLDYLHFNYYSKLRLAAVDLGYTGYQMRITILLPDDPSRMGSIIDNITVEDIQEIIFGMEPTLVELKLPRFKVTSQLNLKEYLQKMGMRSAFDITQCELPYFTGDDSLYINEFVHQAVIEVNEQGTTAAAATAASHATRSKVVKFHVNQPFLFFIRDSRTNLVLFVGKVSKL